MQAALHPQPASPGAPAWLWALAALAIGVALSFWVSGQQRERARAERGAAFTKLADDSFEAVAESLHSCEMLLRSVQTVFLASDDVTPSEFAALYDNLRPRTEFPSLQALAYAQRQPGADGDRYITTLVQPLAGNARVAGLDLATQPGNFAAVLASADSDQIAMSTPFHLVQATGSGAEGTGVTLRLPVYAPGPPPQTLAERRQRLRGSIAASLLVKRVIADAVPAQSFDAMRLTVAEVGGDRLLYDSGPEFPTSPNGAVIRELHFGGRIWQVSMQPRVGLALGWPQSPVWPGLLASVLFALLVWSIAGTRRRALELGWRMSHRYRESEQQFRTLNDLLPALVLLARPEDGLVIYANQAACARLGGGIEQGIALDSLFEDPTLRRRLRGDGEDWNNVDAVLVSLGGDRFWVATSIARIRVGDEQRLLMVASDMSEQRQLTELLGYQASHDNLTELFNRREFERHVRRALQSLTHEAQPYALLYIDLDQFKLINDTSGHLAGDQLLSQLALVMAEVVGPRDVLARLGGDEFGVLLHDTGQAGATALAERLRSRITSHVYVWEHRSYTISASIGVVMLDQPGMTLREVLAQADTACYAAKDHGRNRVHVFSGQDAETIRRRSEMEWANRLRWVIGEGRLLLDYQELRALQPGASEEPHIELLLRLRDEDGRVVNPGAFLPAAERYGLVPELDRWVIGEAIAHFDQLHVSGKAPGRCALNLSAATLEDEQLGDYVLDLIQKHGVPPERLCFEITETEAVRNLARAVRFIERLRNVGCQVALDDFGAGMSSFGYLKNLPVDVIKIDGSFILDLETEPMSRSIVDAITEIGHQRGLDVVAEWVDSERIVEILRLLGVDYGQGYAIHRPERVLYQRTP
ncbi:MAG: EAL domain-containing protein [Pseudomonadota bacterium]|nr:EAL domain-containing protein [Pseudomonadota bacterium]